MFSSKVLTTKDSELWNRLVEQCQHKDIHFRVEYSQVFEQHFGERANLFVFGGDENYLLYPFFVKKINEIPFIVTMDGLKGELFDIASPWYFGGPLACVQSEEIKQELFSGFLTAFHVYCLENNIVAEFSRLHPILKNYQFFLNAEIDLVKEYDVAYVDLNQDNDSIWNNFDKSNKNAVTKAERNGVLVEHGGEELLDEFYGLYIKTMERREAKPFYFFPKEFFVQLFRFMKDNVEIFIARSGKKPIASALFVFGYGIVHYWLSGSDSEFLKMCPNNLMLYKAILWAKENGNDVFFLMGSDNPSLRKFKFSFTNTREKFYTYRKIYNQEAYKTLCHLRDTCREKENVKPSFFPYYRG